MTTTPTSGAADLPDAMHMAELLENPINVVCQKTAAAVLRHQHSELERLHALAAGQATAAQAVVLDDVAALVRAAQAFVLEPDSHKKKLELEAMAWGPLAAATQPAPVLWLSPEQFANFVDADEAPFGKYVPARKTSAGKFTMPLFAARAPAPEQPAAQQPHGAAYAALPEKYYLAGGEVPTWDAKQMHAFADATHTLRASHGQAPAGATEEVVACGNCGGSGRMVRDPDIGTDQECFVCDGSGSFSEPATPQPTQAQAGAAEEIDKALNVYAQAFAARVNGWTRQNGDD